MPTTCLITLVRLKVKLGINLNAETGCHLKTKYYTYSAMHVNISLCYESDQQANCCTALQLDDSTHSSTSWTSLYCTGTSSFPRSHTAPCWLVAHSALHNAGLCNFSIGVRLKRKCRIPVLGCRLIIKLIWVGKKKSVRGGANSARFLILDCLAERCQWGHTPGKQKLVIHR